jgi:hypothetical protein
MEGPVFPAIANIFAPATAEQRPQIVAGLNVREQQAALKFFFAHRGNHAYSYLLLLRFALVNVIGFALLGAAALQGWIGIIHAGDPTQQCTAIAGVFLIGLAICGQRIWKVSYELNQVYATEPAPQSRVGQYLANTRGLASDSRSILASTMRAKLMARIGVVRHFANILVTLGLLGTVVGFIISLSGVKPEVAADVNAVGPMVSNLIVGMSVALYTTLVGAVLNVWLMANYQILATGTTNLIAAIVERGESHVGP